MTLDPTKLNKYLYIEKTPTWRVRLIYIYGIISWLLVVVGFTGAIMVDLFYLWVIGPVILIFFCLSYFEFWTQSFL